MAEISVDDTREIAIRRVMKSLSRLRASGLEFPIMNERGAAPLHIALPTDAVGKVEERVTAMGGAANVIIAFPERFVLIAWDGEEIDGGEAVDIHEHSSIEMLSMWLERCVGPANVKMIRAASAKPRVKELEYQF